MGQTGHARLGPSNHRWPHCPGSVREESRYPYETNDAAVDGTGTHLLVETCLRTLINTGAWEFADTYVGRVIGVGHEDKPEGWLVDQERADRANTAVNYVRRRHDELNISALEVEVNSNPGYYVCGRDDWWGTTDIKIRGVDRATGEKVIEVIDYKDGRVFVPVENNTQHISYAAGQLGPFIWNGKTGKCNPLNDPHTIRMTIIQPRTNPVIRYVDEPGESVWEKARELGKAAVLTDDPEAPLIPGEWCRWCSHGRAGNCAAKNQQAIEGITLMTNITPNSGGKSTLLDMIQSGQVSAETMDDATIANVLDAAALITSLIDQVEAEAFKRIKENRFNDTRYILGRGRKSKKWRYNEETVGKKLAGMRISKKDYMPPTLISPAQALKLAGLSDRQMEKLQKELIDEIPGKEKVVKNTEPVSLDDPATMFLGCDTDTNMKPEQLSFL